MTIGCTATDFPPLKNDLEFAPDAVVLALGVNDVLQMRSASAWREDLRELVSAVRERCGPVPVVFAAVPPESGGRALLCRSVPPVSRWLQTMGAALGCGCRYCMRGLSGLTRARSLCFSLGNYI
ncbi:GDSL-type esterase/lipase family protein [Halomonas salipaludis]|uniref:SGNH hydrolase-type esterase domain-containing protein n=1 Tax=Halomonas salipaludis TaxID=2032625 RepID=A0A2A2F2M2_9GAMM|nr:hypothetical protein CK498_00265 [Halomonas salipaludis]